MNFKMAGHKPDFSNVGVQTLGLFYGIIRKENCGVLQIISRKM